MIKMNNIKDIIILITILMVGLIVENYINYHHKVIYFDNASTT